MSREHGGHSPEQEAPNESGREQQEREDSRAVASLAGTADYYGIKASETHNPEMLRRFAGQEAASIRQQASSKFKTTDFDWRTPKDVLALGQRFEEVAAGRVQDDAELRQVAGTADAVRNNMGGSAESFITKARKGLADLNGPLHRGPAGTLRREQITSRLSGFAAGAVENNDLETAVDALAAAGQLKDPEASAMLNERLRMLAQSETPQDYQRLQEIQRKVADYSRRETHD